MEHIITLHIEKLPEGTLRAILRQAGIEVHEFLDEKPAAPEGSSDA